MKKRIIAMIALCALLLGMFSGCKPQETPAAEAPTEIITRPVAEQNFDFTGATASPRAPQETSKTIQWINMDAYGLADLMMMETLQGNVNREEPSMYIIHDELVEGTPDFYASQFWFDRLDEDYTGADAFTKVEYTNPYEMILANQDKINGAIIYHERLTDSAMASRNDYQGRYGDMAVLNLTLMMCGQYDAIALNYIQYTTLRDEYGLELEILGDTTKFMEKNDDGSFSENRGSREVWARCYKYALDTFGETVCKDGMAHNAGFQAANFDYFIAHDMFIYNRIFNADATEAEREMEYAILNVTKPNTPVFGCWYLQADEGSMIPVLTEKYKYFVVTYESFNLSWSSGLPQEELKPEQDEITLDPTKNYIAFTFTEGDNNSFQQNKMPLLYESASKGEYPIGWVISTTCWETNPNIIRYYRNNWSEGDGLATAEAGLGYVYYCPPIETQDEFFAHSDAHLAQNGTGVIRTLQPDMVDALPFAEKMPHLTGISCGYLETGNDNFNNDLSHFLFRDTVVFHAYDGRTAASLIGADNGTPGFYMITMYGWSQDPSSVETIMENLGDGFVAVTPDQLVDLYKQYYAGEFQDVTTARFNSAMSRSEMGFLYKATQYSDFDSYSGCRIADGENYFIYHFDLAQGVTKAIFDVYVEGNYQIEASSDYLNWTVLARGSSDEKTMVELDASSVIAEGQPLYLRFGDPTPENDNGVMLYSLYLMTDQSELSNVDIYGSEDQAYLVSDVTGENGEVLSEQTEEGRKGEFVYYLPVSDAVTSGDLMLTGETPTVQISSDNETFTELPLHQVGHTWYGRLENLSGPVYLKINSETPVSCVRFSPTPAPVSEISFSPVSNKTTENCLLSLDETEVVETGYNSSRAVTDDNVMVYRFNMDQAVTEAKLMLTTNGLYKVSVSNDGETYTELYKSQVASADPNPNVLDITDYAAGGKLLYLKFESTQDIAGKAAKISKIRILTNLVTDVLLNKIDKERNPNAVVSGGTPGEEALLDQSLSKEFFLYEGVARCLNGNPESCFVYKYDTNSDAFFEALGVEKVDVTKLRITMRIGNAYKLSVSGNGSDWIEILDTNDAGIQAASNVKDLGVSLTEYMQDGVVYVKVSRSDVYETGRTHDGLVWNTQFYLN